MIERKGIILAGGFGTRLHPLTKVTSKQLLPIFDKPMIYYPMSNLIMSGIKEILIISTPSHLEHYKNLIGNGKNFGIQIKYKIQKYPNGIAEGLILAEKFLKGKDLCLILGDNIFYGRGIESLFFSASKSSDQFIFVKEVRNPNKYGVLKTKKNKLIKIIEKPKKFFSKYAVTGVYFFNNSVINEAKKLKPSRRNELEITDLNNLLIKKNKLKIKKLNKFQNWHDAGNHEDYLNTCLNIFRYETKHKTLIGSIEYECYKQGILKRKQIENNSYKNNYYFDSLRSKLDENL
tara:strand:- start:2532 stop:3401 length:870 start_codon:yes stop_codon:yes gene_type:complete